MGFLDSKFFNKPKESRLRSLLFEVHSHVGLIIGVVIIAVGITGSLLVFWIELEEFRFPHLYQIKAPELGTHEQAHGGRAEMLLQPIVERVSKQYPDSVLVGVQLPSDAESPLLVRFRFKEVQKAFRVFVNPYSGENLGALGREPGLLEWVFHLHLNLLAGRVGRKLNGIVGLLCCVLCVTGLVVWWLGRKKWLDGFKIHFKSNWRHLIWDLHTTSGFWVMAGLFVVAFTGVYYCFPEPFVKFVNWATSSSVPPPPPLNPRPPEVGTPPDLDHFVASARAALAGDSVHTIIFPRGPEQPLRVIGGAHGHEAGTRSNVFLDRYTGKVLRVDRDSDRPLGWRILASMGPLHFGTFAGLGSRVVWAILGVMPVFLFGTGLVMWWNRFVRKKLAERRRKAMPESLNLERARSRQEEAL